MPSGAHRSGSGYSRQVLRTLRRRLDDTSRRRRVAVAHQRVRRYGVPVRSGTVAYSAAPSAAGPAVSPLRLALALTRSSGGSACRAIPLHVASVMQRVAFWSCILHAVRCMLHAACCTAVCCMLHVACCTAARRQRRVPLRREPAELCCLLSLHSVRPCRPAAARCTKPNTAALSLQPL